VDYVAVLNPFFPSINANTAYTSQVSWTRETSDSADVEEGDGGEEARDGEEEKKEFKPALIIALTGFSSQKDQEMAFEAGVDIFMTKPVRFREVGRILEGWSGGRE